MKSISEMSVGELAALVYSYLKEHGIEVVLSGGACVTIYSQNKYISRDLDFIESGSTPRRKMKNLLGELGFFEERRYFRHPETDFFLEFPTGPLAVGREPVKETILLSFSTGTLRIISPTDCVKDRLAAYYHWGDRQSLEQAIMVVRDNVVDLQEVERWSGSEGNLAQFHAIKDLLA
ncbi:MAG: hypothetical protein PHU44_15845 [Syntrophales bacterium]|nr:hypothetical protein [Syntrophales bacterium]MDD5641985.1 hypothetical protein [Syntrophales bacterium]